jgi:hypothetical protein
MASTIYDSGYDHEFTTVFDYLEPHVSTDASPHYEFKYCLRYIGQSLERPIPHRNPHGYQMYQNVVKAAIRKNYPGKFANQVIYGYHHPQASLGTIIETLSKADKPIHNVPVDHHFNLAWHITAERFRPPELLRPIHLADMRHYRWNWHPNVEAPFSTNKSLIAQVQAANQAGKLQDARMSFGNLKNVVFTHLRSYMHSMKRNEITSFGTRFPQVTIHTKPALTKIDRPDKVRVIAGVSKLHVIPSAQRFWPLFRYWIESGKTPMLWGFETLLGGMAKLHIDMTIPRLYWQTFVTVDWPNYDLGVNYEERRRCYVTYETYFDFENGYIPTKHYPHSTADPVHLHRAWDWIVEATRLMPIVLPDGSTYVMNPGYWFVYSGLFQTQSDDSLINHARILTILSSLGFEVNKQTSVKVQGDDSLTKLVFHIPPDQHDAFQAAFAEKGRHYFDTEPKPEKIEIHNSPQQVEVLGYVNENGYPVRNEEKLIAMLLHPRGNPTLETLMAKCVGFTYASMYKYPNAISTFQSIWDQLEREGRTAATLRTQRDVILQGESQFTIRTDHMPTMSEVTKYLRQPYERTTHDKEFYFPAYFPDSHFRSFF